MDLVLCVHTLASRGVMYAGVTYYSLKIRGQTVPLSYSTNSYRMYCRRDTIAKLSRHGVPVQKSAKIVRIFVGLCPCQSCALIKTCCRVKKDKFSVSDVQHQ